MPDQPNLPDCELNGLTIKGPLGELRPVPMIVRLEKKLAFMWGHHGAGPQGRKCKDCARCNYRQYSRRFYKCSAYGNSHGPGTDWRVNWPACGIFLERTD